MVIYERTKKVLVIPEGLDGGGHSGGDYERGVADGKAAQKLIDDNKITPTTAITENGSYTAQYGFKEVVVNVPTSGGGCNLQEKSVTLTAGTQTVTPDAGYDGITEADIDASELLSTRYSDGYSDGVDAIRNQFTSTAITRNGTYEMTGEFNAFSSVTVNVPKEIRLGTLVETPLPNDLTSSNYYNKQFQSGGTTDGWGALKLDMTQIIAYGKIQQRDLMSSTTITENGTYTRTNGWNEVTVNVPTSGYQEGYNAAIGEVSSVYIKIVMGGSYNSLALINRGIECNGNAYTIDSAKCFELVASNRIEMGYTGSFGVKYLTPSTLSFLVRTTDLEVWNTNPDGWEITDVRFNGAVNPNLDTYTGGFKASVASWSVATVDEQNSKITITLN